MATPGRRPHARRQQKTTKPPQKTTKPPQKRSPQKKSAQKVVFDAPAPAPEEPRTFRLGVIPGATPGKWVDAWKQRMPRVPLELVPIEVAGQRAAVAELDAALARLPLGGLGDGREDEHGDDDLHIIRLYDEVPVVVASVESHLLAADELHLDDLAGEIVLELTDDALVPFEVPGAVAPAFAALTTAEAIETVASGVGIAIVPMSLARLHHRKDVEFRPLVDGPPSPVALVWARDRTTPDVDTFVGITRGRTAQSSR